MPHLTNAFCGSFDVDFRRAGALLSYHTGREQSVTRGEFIDSYGIAIVSTGNTGIISTARCATPTSMPCTRIPSRSPSMMREDLDALAEEARYSTSRRPM